MDGAVWLVVYILLAIALSAFIWWVCTHYTRLWNRVYEVTPSFHVLCGAAALITFFTTLGFIGLKNMRPVAEEMVEAWSEDVMEDDALASRCFAGRGTGCRNGSVLDLRVSRRRDFLDFRFAAYLADVFVRSRFGTGCGGKDRPFAVNVLVPLDRHGYFPRYGRIIARHGYDSRASVAERRHVSVGGYRD